MPLHQQFCTFYLDDLCFGVEVQRVQEVLRYQVMTRVPLAPPLVRGLINLRGQIVTAIDLRNRLELNDRPADQLPMNVIVQTDDGATSLLVDQIGDVWEVEEEPFERPPETLQGVARDLIRGAYKLKDRLLLILDIDQVVSLESFPPQNPGPEEMIQELRRVRQVSDQVRRADTGQEPPTRRGGLRTASV